MRGMVDNLVNRPKAIKTEHKTSAKTAKAKEGQAQYQKDQQR